MSPEKASSTEVAGERSRHLFEHDLAGHYVTTPDGALLDCDRAFARMFGFASVEEALRHNVTALFPLPEVRRRFLEILRSCRSLERFELEMCRLDGTPVHVVETVVGIFDEQDELVEIAGYLIDDSDRKGLEAQVEAQAFRAQRMESLGTLAGGIAHDLNNVLAPILMSVDVLKPRLRDPEDQATIRTIEAAALHGKDLIRQVLWFARGVEGKRMRLVVGHLVQEIGKIIRDTFPRSIEIVTSVEPELWPVLGDPTQLHQVLMNLCVNARDAMPCVGILRIEVANVVLHGGGARVHFEAEPGRHVRIDVSDSGLGIDEEDLDKIFDPFFTTKEPGQGTGLGLSTVHAIVRSHGGFIEVKSERGRGATFRVYLPALEGGESEAGEELPEEQLPRGGGRLILVVDDDAAFRRVLEKTLLGYDYRVLTACDGAEAVVVFDQHRADIAAVLMDLAMPCLDGPGAIRALRRIDARVPVIAMSGDAGQWGPIDRLGAAMLLEKPFSAGHLLGAVGALLSGP